MINIRLCSALTTICLVACSPGPQPEPASPPEPTPPVSAEPAQPADATAEEIETVIREYFDHFSRYDFESMRAKATPDFETIDHGIRLTHPEFEDFVRNTAQRAGAELNFQLSQFRTRVSGDAAWSSFILAFGNSTNTDMVTLRRVDGEWLIDVFDHQPVSNIPHEVVRQFYHDIKAYNFENMQAMITPGFQIMYAGLSLDWEGFEERHRAEEAELGPTASRPQRYLYNLWDFNVVEENPDTFLVSFQANNPETRIDESGEEVPVFNTNYHNAWVLRRDGGRIKVHFIGSMPASDE